VAADHRSHAHDVFQRTRRFFAGLLGLHNIVIVAQHSALALIPLRVL
jgi:hypothetical protein